MISIRNSLNKKFLILLALILALFVPAVAGAAETSNVGSANELKIALADSESGDITITGAFTLTETLEISRSVTINGGGNTLTAATGVRHFTVTNTGSPTFSNLTLDGGSNGGGVDITGTGAVNFNSVTFNANTGTDGGAVAVTGAATVNFTSPTFTSNTGTNGGAVYIYNAGSKVTFDAATFTGNGTTTSTGGAVYVNAATTTPVTFSTSAVFNNNKAANGGALNLIAGATANFTGTATFGDTSTPNTAATNGGAIYSAGNVNLTGAATFKSNSAATSGGAIYINGAASLLNFSSTASFTSNTADTSGGAIFISGTGSTALEIKSGFNFTSNQATGTSANGGAICTAGAVTVNGGTLESNTATGDGGAIYAEGAVTVTGGTLKTNTVTGTSANGGAIYSSGAVTVSGGTFDTNTSTGDGGAIYTEGTFTLNTAGTFTSNTATGDGGAVYSKENVTVSAGTFTANTATGDGGIIASAGSTINISGGTFNGDTIATVNAANGGAIYASSTTSVMTISGGTFEYNTASGSGGAVYSLGTVKITGGDFTDNASNGALAGGYGGGAVYASTIEVTGSSTAPLTFSGQTAAGSGGALYATTSLTASQVIFDGNSAASGGALRVSSGTALSLTNVSFIGNNTTTVTGGADGGAVFSEAATNTVKNCFFSENLAQIDGGAIALGRDNSTFELEYSYFLNNIAGVASTATHSQGGGAIYLSPVGKVTIESCTFNGNKVTYADKALGGALFIANSSTSKIQNSTFYNNGVSNATDNDGGALYISGTGELTLSFCTFTGNTEAGRGGALFVNTGTLNIIGSIVAGNDTNGDIYNAGGTIISAGYNRIGRLSAGSGSTSDYINWDSNNVGSNAALDIADNGGSRGWKSANFFNENTLAVNESTQRAGAGSDSDYSAIVPTIALDETDPTDTRALDGARNLSTKVVIPNGSYPEYDERHIETVKRANMGAAPDIGAFELYQSSSGDDDNPYAGYTITSIKMSGIPNTLSIVGQTAVLHATVTYANGDTTTTAEPLTWSVTGTDGGSTSIAVIDSSTGSIYTKALGTAIVKVSARNGAYSDSKTLYVVWDMDEANNNIHSTVLNYITQLNANSSNISFYLMATEQAKTLVNNSSFQSAFKKEWGITPTIISFNSSSFGNNASFKSAPVNSFSASETSFNKALATGINTVVNNQSSGAILPVMCVWSFDISVLANEFKADETELDDMTDSAFSKWLFEKMNIGFYRTGDKFRPAVTSSNESTLQSSEFKDDVVTAEDAANSGALSVHRDDGDVTVSMIAYMANVEPDGDTGSKLISSANSQKLLVIPAGTSLSNIDGTLWAAEVTTTNNGSDPKTEKSGGGGGGGGCNTAGLSSALILLASAILLKNKNHA